MRENLLKNQPTWGLRRAQGTGQKSATTATLTKVILVLLTMFLLPSAGWGEGNEYISSTFSGINLGQGEGSGPISYNSAKATTSTTDASPSRIEQGSTATGWDMKNLSANYSICTGANNATSSETNFVLRPIDRGQANTITFTLESQFGINGKFVKAEIIYSYSYIKSITANAIKNAGSSIISIANSNIPFTCSESGTAEATTGTITANASDYSNMVFANNKIDLSFTVTTAAVQSGIPSFTISEIKLYFEDVTEQPFNIWVNGTSLTGQNITTFLDGKLGYTQPQGGNPAILYLKGTTDIQSISTTLKNLEIRLSGENKITASSVGNGIRSSQSSDDGTLTFTTEPGGSLIIESTGASVIRGFGKCTGNLETHEPYNITNYGTNGVYYYLSTNSVGTDTTTIKWLKITEAQTYPLWIAGTQVTESNNGNVLGDSKVSFTPAEENTLATLTLSGANIIGGVDWSGSDNLTIELNGEENSITNMDGDVLKNSNVSTPHPSLLFTKAKNATSGRLTLTTSPNPQFKTIAEFGSHTGLYDLGETENEEVKTRVITSSLLSGGSGTSGDPFKITSAQDLKDFATYINNGVLSNEYFSLENDIDCEELTDFMPIGIFRGTFSGGTTENHTIKNLIINSQASEVGLFGRVGADGSHAVIENLTLLNCKISGGNSTGAIAGILVYGSEIKNCIVNSSTITCSNSAGTAYTGGIVGENVNSTISYCQVSSSTITAISDNNSSATTITAGGIAGFNEGGDINNCEVKGSTKAISNFPNKPDMYIYAGAVIGSNNSANENTTTQANVYESTVTTTAKGVEYKDQAQRGIGKEDGSCYDIPNQVMMAGTKKVTISATLSNGTLSLGEMANTYYLAESDASTGQLLALYVLPESAVSLVASSEEGYKPTFKLSNNNVAVTPKEFENSSRTIQFNFEMPADDVTATIAFARDLGSTLYTLKTDKEAYTYTGKGIEPRISLTISTDSQNPVTVTLSKDTDFEIQKCMKDVDGTFTPIFEEDGKTPKTPVDAGSYQVYISGIGSYTGEAELEFSIEKATTDECLWFYHLVDGKVETVLSVEEATYGTAYDAPKLKNPLNLAVTLSCNAENGSNGTASDVATIDANGNLTILKAGTVYVYAVTEGNENYEAGEVHYQLDIEKGSLENVTITEIDDQVYTGTAIEPELAVTTRDGTSVTTDDYGIGYTPDNTNVGEVTITLTATEGSEKFTGSTTVTFNIIPPTPTIAFDHTKTYLNTDKIEISIDETYATSSVTAGITNTIYYSWDENPVTGTEYSEGGVAAQTGTLTAWVSATKSGATYESEKTTQAFTVKKDIASCTVTLPENTTYTGAAFVPVVAPNGTTTTLTEGTDYTVSYQKVAGETATDVESMIDAGTYKITITGKGNYGGTKEISEFQIAQARLEDAAISKLIVGDKEYTSEVDKVIEIPYTGEAIQPEVVVIFNDGTVTVDASEYTVSYGNNTEVSTTTLASVTVTSTGKNFITGTSTSQEFKIVPASVTISAEAQTVTYNAEQQAYTGASVDNENVTLGIAYYTSEEDRTNALNALTGAPTDAGTYYVSVTLNEESQQRYTAEPANVTFTIAQLDISEAVITLDNEELTYNGEEQSVTVEKVMVGDIEVAAEYYEVSGNSGTEARNYTLTVTAKLKNSDGSDFKNNFTRSAEKAWKINHRTASAEELGFKSETQTASTYYNSDEDFNLPEGYVGYIITGINGNSVTTQRVSYIPKGVAVLVEKGQSSEPA